MKNKLINAIILFVGIFVSIIYLEVLFKIRVMSFSFDFNFFRIKMFVFYYALFIMFFLMFFKEKTVKITSLVLISIITFLYLNQEVYSSFVEGFYSFTVIGDFTAGLSFFSDYFTALRFGHIFYLVPITAFITLFKYNYLNYDIEYFTLKQPLIMLLISAMFFYLSTTTIDNTVEIQNPNNEEVDITNAGTLISYSDIDLYTYVYNSQEALKKFGLLTYTQRDFMSLFRNDPITEQAYEILIDDYLNNLSLHSDNDYTGLLEDKNFIMIMAESLDTFAIHETLTPTLWQLKQDYGYFENYYSPLYYRSTADSEFLVQTSMFPNKNVTLSMDTYINNTFPNTLPNLFREDGYNTYSFHNYTDYFYPRSDFHLNTLGYDQYWGSEELGITSNFNPDEVIFDHEWQSDYDLMRLAVPKFINDNRFFVNMLTVSGHFQYSASHEMAKPEYVNQVNNYFDNLEEPIDVSNEIIYYLAVSMEFDKAMNYLITELEANNLMDDTVIMIFGDHYAYGIDNDAIWDYEDEYKNDDDELDIHNVPMMIISNLTALQGTKSEYFSTIDIMPTVANLFDLPMNYTQVFGHDAFEDETNIVRFANGSFISEAFRYDSMTEQYEIYDINYSNNYLVNLNTEFINDYMYNVRILEYDYYKDKE